MAVKDQKQHWDCITPEVARAIFSIFEISLTDEHKLVVAKRSTEEQLDDLPKVTLECFVLKHKEAKA